MTAPGVVRTKARQQSRTFCQRIEPPSHRYGEPRDNARSTCALLWLGDYRMPESQSHWTLVILPGATSTSKGP